MAKAVEEGDNTGAMPNRSEGSVKNNKEDRKPPQAIPPSAVQDNHSRFDGKESSLSKKVCTDEQDVSNTSETGEAKRATVSPMSDFVGLKKKPKPSPDLENLRSYVEQLGGKLEDGWHVQTNKRYASGKLKKRFVSPTNQKFWSRVEVAKHLGLSLNLLKRGKTNSGSESALSEMDHDNDKHHSVLIDGHVNYSLHINKGAESNPHEHGLAEQKRESGSSACGSQDEAVANVNSDIAMASSTLDGQVGIQKAPTISVVTERCRDALRSITSTENFATISNILNRGSSSGSLESPIQLNVLPGSIDLQLIHLRLSNGVYGLEPELFSTDLKQVWKSMSAVGNELVTLAQSLLEFSDQIYEQQVMRLFEVSAAKGVSEERDKEFPGSQLGNKQTVTDSLISFNLPEKVQVSHTDTSTVVCEKTIPMQTYKSKRMDKTANKSKKRLVLKADSADKNILKTCKVCGLEQGDNYLVCELCKAVFHNHCTGSLSNEPHEGEWCCHLCAVNESKNAQILAESVEKSEQLAKATGRAGVCEACKKEDDNVLRCDECEAVYHMNCIVPVVERVPDESWFCPKCAESQKSSGKDIHEITSVPHSHNCSVCIRIPKASLTLNKTEYDTEDTVLEYSLHTSGGKSPAESFEHLAPKDDDCTAYPASIVDDELDKPGSSVAIVHDEHPELGILLGNENACKACGVNDTKPMISCSFCTNRYHLSCLKPALKRVPRNAWYCPSCLCRVCKIDTDDDKILLCDTCDEGYHSYCLNPPLDEKPNGSWFCPSCMKPKQVPNPPSPPKQVPNPPSPKQIEVAKRKRKSTEPRRST